MFLYSWSWLLVFLISIACIVHVIRRGREFWWIFVILFFPVLGCLVYFFLEILPDLRRGELGKDLADAGEKLRSPKARIRKLEHELENTPTIEKKVELAEAYGEAGDWKNACERYSECAEGPFGDDPFILYGFAYARFRTGEYRGAEKLLDLIDHTEAKDKRQQRRLLRLRIFEETDRREQALRAYPALLEEFSGEEARFRYGKLLRKIGRGEEANELFTRMNKESKGHSKLYLKQNREWIQAARRELNKN